MDSLPDDTDVTMPVVLPPDPIVVDAPLIAALVAFFSASSICYINSANEQTAFLIRFWERSFVGSPSTNLSDVIKSTKSLALSARREKSVSGTTEPKYEVV